MEFLLDRRADTRNKLDDKGFRPPFFFAKVSTTFMNEDVNVHHPPSWKDRALTNFGRHEIHKSKKLSSEEKEAWLNLDPNDKAIFQKPWNGEDLNILFKNTMKLYNEAMAKWRKGTGGGPGFPENYCQWESREKDWFSNYASSPSAYGPCLTWIYMTDCDKTNILSSPTEEVPHGTESLLDEDSTISSPPKKQKIAKSLRSVSNFEHMMQSSSSQQVETNKAMLEIMEKGIVALQTMSGNMKGTVHQEKMSQQSNTPSCSFDQDAKALETLELWENKEKDLNKEYKSIEYQCGDIAKMRKEAIKAQLILIIKRKSKILEKLSQE